MSKIKAWWQMQTGMSVVRFLLLLGMWLAVMKVMDNVSNKDLRMANAILAGWSMLATLTAILALSFKWTIPLPKQ